MSDLFPPSRDAALARLNAFLPQAGRDYASRRNYDLPGHKGVSRLSPYLRYRMINEPEVLAAVTQKHSPSAAEKFIAEVCWRTYWKGVLELRPSLWIDYKSQVQSGLNRIQTEGGLRADWEAACTGETGIECFDHWAKELVETGYMHNHARMWFASIWIFTLRLPWALGADFFLRHLLDGCPASNTLSWRWVGGLQTRGKTYLARPDNIAKYTEGRFNPKGLAYNAPPLDGPPLPAVGPAPTPDTWDSGVPTGTLVTMEDLHPDHILGQVDGPIALLTTTGDRSPLETSEVVNAFTQAIAKDAPTRLGASGETVTVLNTPNDAVKWASENGLKQIRTSFLTQGPLLDALASLKSQLAAENVNLCMTLREHDRMAWPSATHGFFRFKSVIPKLIADQRQISLI